MSTSEPFGRQPEPVLVTLVGDAEDVRRWMREFMRRAESCGDLAQGNTENSFTIYHRAVND